MSNYIWASHLLRFIQLSLALATIVVLAPVYNNVPLSVVRPELLALMILSGIVSAFNLLNIFFSNRKVALLGVISGLVLAGLSVSVMLNFYTVPRDFFYDNIRSFRDKKDTFSFVDDSIFMSWMHHLTVCVIGTVTAFIQGAVFALLSFFAFLLPDYKEKSVKSASQV